MLYTVIPLERIYSNMTQSIITSQSREEKNNGQENDYKDVSLKHGSLRARKEGENYIVEEMVSTDPSDYLNQDYAPGSTLK